MKIHYLPKQVKKYQDTFKLNYNNLLSVNPKTEKSKIKTFLLHLAPSNQSGIINVCPNALNCAKLCLHHAGNPLFYSSKIKSRINKTYAYSESPNQFIELLIMNIVRNLKKYKDIAIRLNGTSDILWENIPINISLSVSNFIYSKFSYNINSGYYENIFEVFKNESFVRFYDYTKMKRDYNLIRKYNNYHITFSFDGATNKKNIDLSYDAMENFVNLASVINIKKSEYKPNEFNSKVFNKTFKCFDGDADDMRFNDPLNRLILLRFKKPYNVKYSKNDIKRFCMA